MGFEWLLPVLFSVLLFLVPLFPDVRLSRPKLLAFETGLYGLFFLWLFTQAHRGMFRVRSLGSLLPVGLYCALSGIFYYLSPDKPVALNELKRGLLSATGFIIASNIIENTKQRQIVLAGWMGGSFLAICYGLMQHSGGIGMLRVPQFDRVMSTFGNPIFFAAHVVIVIPIILGLFAQNKNALARLFLGIMGIAAFTALYWSQTRAAFIACALSLVVFLLLAVESKKKKQVLLAAVAILCVAAALGTHRIWNRHQAHTLIWRDSLAMWLHTPWTGIGPGTFHIYFPQYASEELKKVWPQDKFIVNDAHNEYVQYLCETGILGFGVFLLLIASFYRTAFIVYRKRPQDRAIISGLIASATGILAQNFFSVDMRFIISAVYLFIVMGLVASFDDDTTASPRLGPGGRAACFMAIAFTCLLTYQKVLEPYRAQQKVAATPDFFDEKVLEPARTIADLETLAKQYPNQALVFEKLGWVYAKEKNWPRAIESYLTANRLNPRSAGPLNNLGNISFLNGDRNAAITYWTQSLAINPGQVDSRLNLATAYFYQGKLKEAAAELKEVLKTDPHNEKAIVMLKQMTE